MPFAYSQPMIPRIPYAQQPQDAGFGTLSNYGAPAPTMFSDPGANALSVANINANAAMGLAPPNSAGLFSTGLQIDPAFSGIAAGATGIPSAGGGSIWDNFLTKNGNQGWGGMALGTLGGMANLYLGLKQYGLAKKQLEEGKRQFELNYDAQRKLTNSQLEDRQRARVASNPGGYESVGSYMDRNGIK